MLAAHVNTVATESSHAMGMAVMGILDVALQVISDVHSRRYSIHQLRSERGYARE
jgi:choline dehydrogenase-like flavoprotein